MRVLYSNILPMGLEDGQESVADCFREQAERASSIEIAVGYVSKASLIELDEIIRISNIRNIILTMGMYYVEGMPEAVYHTAMAINERWVNDGIGEIRLVRAFKYHGKIYAFYNEDGEVISVIIGSANLGVIKLEASNRRQYELSAITEEPAECNELATHIRQLQNPSCSARIDSFTDITLIREVNTSLSGIDLVEQITIILPIKVPAYAERHMDDGRHYTKSNLNVSYAAPRSARKSRDWYETQFTVNKKITTQEGYPEKNVTFAVVTDDGYTFKAHTTSDGNKQFSAVGDELIMGRWIKGRLAAAGLVTPVNDTQADRDRQGVITKEMLAAYGRNTLVLTKTTQKIEEEDGNLLDVWILSFEAAEEGGNDE